VRSQSTGPHPGNPVPCRHAPITELAIQPDSGAWAAERPIEAGAAKVERSHSIGRGDRATEADRSDDALDSLRGCIDVTLLLMDLAAPSEAFGALHEHSQEPSGLAE
jgi:hypothetical protein